MTQTPSGGNNRHSIIVSVAMLISVATMGILAYLSLYSAGIQVHLLKKIYSILNILSVAAILLILILRKTLYFSKRMVPADLETHQVLKKWNTIDIVLMAMAEQIAVFGLVLSFLGMPFHQLFHFFVTSALLILILMPNQTRTEMRLQAFRDNSPRTIC